MSKVRVRFAPSPTGTPHVGNIRSALFNYLFARNQGGEFLFRIEDTDRERFVAGSEASIIDSLKWLGIEPDGEKLTQSERLDIYHEQAEVLLKDGRLYKDYTSSDRLAELRKRAQENKEAFKFTKDMAQLEPGFGNEKYVLRLEIGEGKDISWKDEVWGEQTWQRDVLDDFVAIKSDGYPTYHFASVVDDHLMKISHVIRAAEWIPSTPKHIALYEAFGWDPPKFAHLPQVLGPDKAKLSKRHGAKSVLEYRENGYLPEALFNFLASLGFNDGTTQEIYTHDELVKAFSLERVQSSPAVFDSARLEWMNGTYIRELELDELYGRCESYWPERAKNADDALRKSVLSLVQERLKFLAELPELTDFFFADPTVDSKLLEKYGDPKQLEGVVAVLKDSDFSEADLESKLRKYVEDNDLKTGKLFGLIRVALTGKTQAPGLFETMRVLGKDVSLRRLENAAT